MIKTIDNSYIIKYLNWVKSQPLADVQKYQQAIELMRAGVKLTSHPDYMPGYPKYNKNRSLLKEFGFDIVPGIDNTTWCICLVYYLADALGYDVSGIVKDQGIWYTNGNAMAELLKKNYSEIGATEAMNKANDGKVVVAASIGRTGHVGIVSPTIPENMCTIIQAGGINGFIPIFEAFPDNIIDFPTFHMLPKK